MDHAAPVGMFCGQGFPSSDSGMAFLKVCISGLSSSMNELYGKTSWAF